MNEHLETIIIEDLDLEVNDRNFKRNGEMGKNLIQNFLVTFKFSKKGTWKK